MLSDFRNFLMRGNVFDLAVGVVIGAAFGKVVSSFVGDILTPLLSLFLGKVDFSHLFIAMDGKTYANLAEAKNAGAATLNLGVFASSLMDFVIVGFALFILIKFVEKMKARSNFSDSAPALVSTKECPHCFSNISMKATRCPHCTSSLI